MIPRTAILTAPDASDALGSPMSSTDLVKGLRACNSNLTIPLPEHFASWYPGQKAGQTCLWLGAPGSPGSRKLCAFHLGSIPEWTQVDPNGVMIARGWRSILDKCIRQRVVTKRSVERVFKISMDIGGKDKLCRICRKDGKRVAVNGASDLCEPHRDAQTMLRIQREANAAASWSRAHPAPPKRGPYVFHRSKNGNPA